MLVDQHGAIKLSNSTSIQPSWSFLHLAADFGLSAELQEDEQRKTTAGTTYWMAPEIIQGEQYGIV